MLCPEGIWVTYPQEGSLQGLLMSQGTAKGGWEGEKKRERETFIVQRVFGDLCFMETARFLRRRRAA